MQKAYTGYLRLASEKKGLERPFLKFEVFTSTLPPYIIRRRTNSMLPPMRLIIPNVDG